MTYSVVVCEGTGKDCAENNVPLLFTGRCLVTAGCCDSTVLALSKYDRIFTEPLECRLGECEVDGSGFVKTCTLALVATNFQIVLLKS
jgi:hypothetical protein